MEGPARAYDIGSTVYSMQTGGETTQQLLGVRRLHNSDSRSVCKPSANTTVSQLGVVVPQKDGMNSGSETL